MSGNRRRYDSTRVHRSIIFFVAVLLTFSLARPSHAQLPDTLSAAVRVSLVTTYPGDEIYSAFAHTALRFQDLSAGYDVVFNYGTFDSRDPLFIPKFMYGELDYFLDAGTLRRLLATARYEKRGVVEQSLSINGRDGAYLYALLRENARPENRVYRYDFLRENCATKILTLAQNPAIGTIRFDSSTVAVATFRELLDPYLTATRALDAGIDLLLGSTVDRKTTFFERSFLPIELMDAFDHATYTRNGAEIPLVASKDTLVWYPERDSPPNTFPWLSILFWGLLVAWFFVDRRVRPTRVLVDRWFIGGIGVLGVLLLFMWIGTIHTVTTDNWNLAWALPTHLIVALFWHRLPRRGIRWYLLATGLVLITLGALQPVINQALHPAFVPVIVALLWRCWVRGRR